jgi:ABC-type polysaccharide/polyol phosphate transport system ATPase subunit
MEPFRLRGVSKRFWISYDKPALARRLLPGVLRPQQLREHWALRDVTLDVERGKTLGVIGPNGAGKTTLLSLMARITAPTAGTVDVQGTFVSLLSLGSGFHPELTGRENVFLNGTLVGMRGPDIRRAFDAIVAFSGLEGFIDAPLSTYSTGMQLRLGFAIAAHVEADGLLMDEVLAVGDLAFQQRCLDHLARLRRDGKLLVLISQRLDLIEQLCARVVLLDRGRLIADGPPPEVVAAYRAVTASAGTAPRDAVAAVSRCVSEPLTLFAKGR